MLKPTFQANMLYLKLTLNNLFILVLVLTCCSKLLNLLNFNELAVFFSERLISSDHAGQSVQEITTEVNRPNAGNIGKSSSSEWLIPSDHAGQSVQKTTTEVNRHKPRLRTIEEKAKVFCFITYIIFEKYVTIFSSSRN